MENQKHDSEWRATVKNIFTWVHNELDNSRFKKYGLIPINEQTVYRVPGNSHSARQASAELKYWQETGDTTYVRNAIRMLNWATYMVDCQGRNFYPNSSEWLTDGYGDYVRHYLRSMAAAPELSPDDADHLLKTSSIVNNISYESSKILYSVFDNLSEDIFRLTSKPKKVFVDETKLQEVFDNDSEGWQWQSLPKGGILKIKQSKGKKIEIRK